LNKLLDFDPNFDPGRDLRLVADVRAAEDSAILEFTDRLRCVPRILAAENRRRGRPLDEHDLADLVQDSVIVVLDKLDDYVGTAPLEGWIARICRLEFMNGLRRKWRRRARSAGSVEDFAEQLPAPPAGDVGDRDAVHFALAQLADSDADLVRLKHFVGLTFPEIARRLSLSPNTCKTRYYRALTQLELILRREACGVEEQESHG